MCQHDTEHVHSDSRGSTRGNTKNAQHAQNVPHAHPRQSQRHHAGHVPHSSVCVFFGEGGDHVWRRNILPDVVELLEECNEQWAGAWRLGGAACGDESMVPHKGICAAPLRMFIARKPHSTGIKLYCLADATSGYVVDMYLYRGRRGHLRRFGNSAGNFNAQEIMTILAGLPPLGTILCADSFFGSHELARDLAAERHALLMMSKRST